MSTSITSPTKVAVAFALHSDDKVLLVRRPSDDVDLPHTWSIPAGILHENESHTEAVMRVAREKLGITITSSERLLEGSAERTLFTLKIHLYGVKEFNGTPAPQRLEKPGEKTVYTDCSWFYQTSAHKYMAISVGRGSLGCGLYLAHARKVRGKDLERHGIRVSGPVPS